MRDGVIVDFCKIIDNESDFFGASVKFFCLSGHMAEALSPVFRTISTKAIMIGLTKIQFMM